eukprot:TRINITY_DN23365_c0_g1_i1.p1 TRINITY_DN23365_c0_g1~~TRINITY_DN23365_c0_g1_i1.p1  ORF type:complete len:337 (+),score=76.46 TRINITY_DN23365_c0_g1_i1:78-1013(+)
MSTFSSGRMELFNLSINDRTYRVFQSTLGVGYRSKVRSGICLDTNLRCAIKIVEKSSREAVNQRARREIEVLRKLQGHPNIIKLFDAHEDGQYIYLVLERHEYTLLDLVERTGGLLAPARAAQIFRQLVSALLYCQSFNIAHLDVKLENVMISASGSPVLIDFGFAEEIARGQTLAVGRGSFRYVPPEIAGYEEFEPAKADAWALGVLLFAMCAGRLPFSGDENNVPRLFRHIRAGKYLMPATFPDELRSLVSGLLQVDPLRRLELTEMASHPFVASTRDALRVSGSCSDRLHWSAGVGASMQAIPTVGTC